MLLILRHLLVARCQILAEHVWSAKSLNEGADPPAANDIVESLVDLFIKCKGQLLLHETPLVRVEHVSCRIHSLYATGQ